MPDKRLIAFNKIFLYACFVFLISVFLYEIINLPQNLVLGFFLFSFFLFSFLFLIFKKRKTIFIKIILLVLALIFSFSFGYLIRSKIDKRIESSLFREKSGKLVEFVGVVRDVEKEDNKINLVVNIFKRKEEGKVLITLSRLPEYEYGDKIKVKGKLQKPPKFEDFNYRKHLETKEI